MKCNYRLKIVILLPTLIIKTMVGLSAFFMKGKMVGEKENT
jgi:hypothetical protein